MQQIIGVYDVNCLFHIYISDSVQASTPPKILQNYIHGVSDKKNVATFFALCLSDVN